jgi:prefoldin subunit 5
MTALPNQTLTGGSTAQSKALADRVQALEHLVSELQREVRALRSMRVEVRGSGASVARSPGREGLAIAVGAEEVVRAGESEIRKIARQEINRRPVGPRG